MQRVQDVVPRRAERLVEEALAHTPVVPLNGAGQAGKSTLARLVAGADVAGLRHLQRKVGDRFVAGYVLCTGQQTLPCGDRLRALPIDALRKSSP